MATAVASMAGLSHAVRLESSLAGAKVTSKGPAPAMVKCAPAVVRASAEETQSRRSFFGLAAAALAATALVKDASALETIKLQPAPPLSGGLPGTDNADEARDFDLDLKKRFYIQPLAPEAASDRVKSAVAEIKDVKPLIDRKAWPYVMNGLRLSGSYLRYDLSTIGSSKPKDQKKAFRALATKAYDALDSLDYAARMKDQPKAIKAYANAVAALDQVVSSI